MKKLILIITILLSSFTINAEVVQKGNNFIQVEQKNEGVVTPYVYTDKNGKTYPILKSSRNSFYIIKISKTTGKEYKYYLPKDVQEKIKKQMGIF